MLTCNGQQKGSLLAPVGGLCSAGLALPEEMKAMCCCSERVLAKEVRRKELCSATGRRDRAVQSPWGMARRCAGAALVVAVHMNLLELQKELC
jgi:hypothetical protein